MTPTREDDDKVLAMLMACYDGTSTADAAKAQGIKPDYARALISRIKREDLAMSGENADIVARAYKIKAKPSVRARVRAIMKWEN